MSRSDEKRLDDIRDMCAMVASLVDRGRVAVEADGLLWLALERAIEIAGEAATQVSAGTKATLPEVAWKELGAVRVVLAHAYHRVDLDLPKWCGGSCRSDPDSAALPMRLSALGG